ncbi:MAG TPA: hypothetical protein VGG45_16130 [Terracidiphilus sp.]|jgi:hypothetical protein
MDALNPPDDLVGGPPSDLLAPPSDLMGGPSEPPPVPLPGESPNSPEYQAHASAPEKPAGQPDWKGNPVLNPLGYVANAMAEPWQEPWTASPEKKSADVAEAKASGWPAVIPKVMDSTAASVVEAPVSAAVRTLESLAYGAEAAPVPTLMGYGMPQAQAESAAGDLGAASMFVGAEHPAVVPEAEGAVARPSMAEPELRPALAPTTALADYAAKGKRVEPPHDLVAAPEPPTAPVTAEPVAATPPSDLIDPHDPEDVAAAESYVRQANSPMPKPQSLFQAIKQAGGIATKDENGAPLPDAGEIGATLKDVKYPGLINGSGMTPDYMREHLAQEGWFGGNPEEDVHNTDLNDFYDLLGREAQGDKVYHPANQDYFDLLSRRQMDEELGRAGIGSGDDVPTAAQKLLDYRASQSPEPHLAEAEHGIDQDFHDLLPETQERLQDEGYEPGADIGSEHEEASGFEDASPPADLEPSGAVETAPDDREANGSSAALEPTVQYEAGAEGLPQSIIPGAEQSARQLAAAQEASGHGRMGADVAQRDPGGMFAEPAAEQQTLFQRGDIDNPINTLGPRVALADDLIAHLPENPLPHEQRILDGVGKIAQKIVPSAKVIPARALETDSEFDRQAGTASNARTLGATYTNGMRRLIAWSLESPDAEGTLRHEAIHYLKNSNFIKPAEWNALERAAKAGDWIGKHNIDARYPGGDDALKTEEAVAEEFSNWRRAPSKLPPFIAKTFGRLQQLLQQIGDHVRRAFGADATPNDVFSRIQSGEVGTRDLPMRMARSEPTAYQREPAEVQEQSKTPRGVYARLMGEGADEVGRRISSAIDKYMPVSVKELGEHMKMALSPMAAGSPRARATAKDFMNTQRRADFEWGKVDEHLEKTYSPEDRKAMWDAGDEQDDLLRAGKVPGPNEGLNKLPPDQRATMDELNKRATSAFDVAKQLGMVKGEGVDYWVPRMVVRMTGEGAERVGRNVEKPGSVGRNLTTTTGNIRERKYDTAEETEAAAQAKFGEGATVVHDVRTVALGVRNLEKAIAGRMMIDRIKDMGKEVGEPVVQEGGASSPQDFFTLDHPAFQTWGPKFVTDETGKTVPALDQNGQTQFEAKPLYVSKEFEGPLKAVLSKTGNKLYQGLMDLKGRMMSTIMWSPLMHNQVIWGKALPAAPLKLLTPFYTDEHGAVKPGIQLYGEGAVARRDPEMMRRALDAGMDPIGHRYFNQDITAIAEPPQIAPGRSWTAKAIGNAVGLFDKDGAEAVKRKIDHFGDFWHNTMLWDRVADLQMGIFSTLTKHFEEQGMSAESADRAAAHFANRYAGALPMEAMSKGARMTANLMLFSRSFTLGNLGAYKDFTLGLPRDVQAQILRDKGVQELQNVQSVVRRKALSMLLIDMGLSRLGNYGAAYAAHAIRQGMGQPNNFQPPAQNEPDKTNKFLIGHAEDGTALYGRMPTGKVGEELMDWGDEPMDTLKRKLSPYARLVYEAVANDRGYGRKLYDPYDKTPAADAKAMAKIVMAAMDSVFPTQMAGSVLGATLGPETKAAIAPTAEKLGVSIPRTRGEAVLGVALPAAGVTVSHGAPGGEASGFYYRAKDEQQYQIGEAMPSIRAQILSGQTAEAEKHMTSLGMDRGYQKWVIRTSLNPQSRVSPRTQRMIQQSGFEATQSAPQYADGGRIHAAAAEADKNPTPAQIEAGNYRKGHVTIHGFDLSIETPKGVARRGLGADGKPWENRHSSAHYGYIKRTIGADNEHVDAYIGPHPESTRIFVVNQFDPKTKKFDEHKLVFGAKSSKAARAIYDDGFSDGSGPKRRWSTHELSPSGLKAWLDGPHTKRPMSERHAQSAQP